MGDGFFAEEGDYIVFCYGTEVGNGRWEGSTTFERKRDQTSATIPSYRHRMVNATFETESDAIHAAYEHGLALIKEQRVGFE